VNRALDKLRAKLAKAGVTLGAALIASAVATNSVQAAPVGVAKTISVIAATKGAAATASILALVKGTLNVTAWAKAKTTILATSALVILGTTVVVFDPWKNMEGLTKEIQKINQQGIDVVRGDFRFSRISAQKQDKDFEDAFVGYFTNVAFGVTIQPSKYSPRKAATARRGNNMIVERGVPFQQMLVIAYEKTNEYEFSAARMALPTEMPVGNFDFLVYEPTNGLEKLQMQIAKQFGLVGHIQIRETNALVLKLRNPNAPGLRPNAKNNLNGRVFFSADTLADGLERFNCLRPVIDETGLTDFGYSFVVPFEPMAQASINKLLLSHYGLELIPTNMPIEMLVVEKVK